MVNSPIELFISANKYSVSPTLQELSGHLALLNFFPYPCCSRAMIFKLLTGQWIWWQNGMLSYRFCALLMLEIFFSFWVLSIFRGWLQTYTKKLEWWSVTLFVNRTETVLKLNCIESLVWVNNSGNSHMSSWVVASGKWIGKIFRTWKCQFYYCNIILTCKTCWYCCSMVK